MRAQLRGGRRTKGIGWVALALGPVLGLAPGAALACACCSTHGVVGVSADDVLNIRERATVRSPRVGYIPAGYCGIGSTGVVCPLPTRVNA